jgi:hypothetical protein
MTARQKDGKRGRSGLRYSCSTHGAALNTHGCTQSGNGRILPLLKKVNITRPGPARLEAGTTLCLCPRGYPIPRREGVEDHRVTELLITGLPPVTP